jgi:predicted DNA-binding transcriptional regulator AlpA
VTCFSWCCRTVQPPLRTYNDKKEAMNNSELPQYLDLQAVQRILPLSRTQLYYLIQIKALPSVMIGRRVLVDPIKLKAWLDAGGDRRVARRVVR